MKALLKNEQFIKIGICSACMLINVNEIY